ncbi:MAG TPA: Xaa-Pro dipeptidyl-peptidase, partial [Phycisphaerae bacterium]|nr:Xaa-Pro dipeptidyl-peptidase [Phycisphaerae bacterium]
VDVTRPPQTETEGLKLPVIYQSSPYFAGTGNAPDWDVNHELGEESAVPRGHGTTIRIRNQRPVISTAQVNTWVPRGFIVVHSEAPGTGLSDGIATVGSDPECLAPKAVIDWLNGRAKGFTSREGNEEVKAYWTTGKVGMTGTSYEGTLPLAAACTGVEGLACIIPVSPNTSYYHYYRSYGLVRSPGGYLGEDVDNLFDFVNSGNLDNPTKRALAAAYRDNDMVKGIDRITGDYNDFWATRDLLQRVDKIKCAVLFAHGFNDWNVVPEHTIRMYEAIKDRVPAQLYMHQGGHGGDPPLEMRNKWFTRYLFDVQNGVEKDAKAWIVREGASAQQPTPYKDYPNPDASSVVMHVSGDGLKTGVLATAVAGAQGKETMVDDASFRAAQLASAESNHRLLFATPVLSQPVHISGYPKVTVKLASSKAAANLSVYLVVLPQTPAAAPAAPAAATTAAGSATSPATAAGRGRGGRGGGAPLTNTLITRAWADPQNYKSLTKDAPVDYHSMAKGEPLVPGKFYEMTFALEPDDQIIPAGKQIGLMIFSSDPEFTLHPKAGTELTVDLAGTTLDLPVVGGGKALEEAVQAK